MKCPKCGQQAKKIRAEGIPNVRNGLPIYMCMCEKNGVYGWSEGSPMHDEEYRKSYNLVMGRIRHYAKKLGMSNTELCQKIMDDLGATEPIGIDFVKDVYQLEAMNIVLNKILNYRS